MWKFDSVVPVYLLTLSCLVAACHKETPSDTGPAQPPAPTAYFKTSFQDESQYIVEAIVSELAEEIYYAAHQQFPEKKDFLVAVKEKPDSNLDTPTYVVQVRFDGKAAVPRAEVTVDAGIWSPEVYRGITTELAKAAGLKENPTTRGRIRPLQGN